MTLHTSGAISLQQVNTELGNTATLNVPPSTLCAVVYLYPENQE